MPTDSKRKKAVFQGEGCKGKVTRSKMDTPSEEEPLREREARMRSLANSIPGVAYQYYVQPNDSRGLHFVSKHAETVLGISAEPEDFFERFLDCVPASHREELTASIDTGIKAEKGWSFEMPFKKPSGEQIWLHNVATPETTKNELVFNGVFQDITRRRRLEREIIAVSDRERRRIGENLHDVLASKLAGTAMVVRSSAKSVGSGKEISSDKLHELADRIEKSSEQARTLSHSLMPLEVQGGELQAGFQELADRQEEISGIICSFEAEGKADLSEDVAAHLYRMGAEAVHNALRHAEPSRVDIRLRVEADHLVMTVEDDGKGIPEEIHPADAHGLHLMQYRSNLIGAHLDVGPLKKGGTLVQCSLPLENAS